MLALIRMSWTLNRRLLYWMSPVFGFYLLMAVTSRGQSQGPGLLYMGLALAGTTGNIFLIQGLSSNLDAFVLALPVSRTQVVCGRYASTLLAMGASMGLVALTVVIGHSLRPIWVPGLSLDDLKALGLLGLGLCIWVFALLPFVYRLGFHRGMVVFSLALSLPLLGAVAHWGWENCQDALVAFLGRILDQGRFAMGVIATVALAGIGSLLYSCWSYERRPFKSGKSQIGMPVKVL